ncbi:DNA primase family protein [Desulfosediminicola sp.]|uniref:DNA primase family protein n=1 Tax=Desulfosediminicola sp. TaxID=2886825 RepID=UPI003AF297F2
MQNPSIKLSDQDGGGSAFSKSFHCQTALVKSPVKSGKKNQASPGKVTFSAVTSDKGILTKIIREESGVLVRDSSQCCMVGGVVETLSMTQDEFALFLRQLHSGQAILHGVSKYDRARICTKAEFGRLANSTFGNLPLITRTRDFLSYPNGPGLLMLDHDKPRDNAVAQERKALSNYTPEELIFQLSVIHPEIAEAAYVATPSTSSCIFDKHGTELRGEGNGSHTYIFVKEGTDIPRYLKVCGQRLVLAGYGRCEISRSGTLLMRTLVDLNVGNPERLDFCAGAVCEGGLVQKLPEPGIKQGTFLDTRLLPDLKEDENELYEEIIRDLRERAKPRQRKNHAIYLENEIDKIVAKTKVDPGKARAIVLSRQNHILKGSDVLHFAFNGGAPVSVKQVLVNWRDYDRQSLADPLEPDYGGGSMTKAKFFWNNGVPRIHSFAHGSVTYSFEAPSAEDTDYIIQNLLVRVTEDCGAAFEAESIRALADLKIREKNRYIQIRNLIKSRNSSVLLGELDRDINLETKKRPQSASSPSSLSFSNNYRSEERTSSEGIYEFSCSLVEADAAGKEKLVPQSTAAVLIAQEIKGLYAFDKECRCWRKYEGSRWRECTQLEFDNVVAGWMYKGAGILGFSSKYMSGVTVLLEKGGQLHLPTFEASKIPFLNGVLDIATGTLDNINDENASTWVMPWAFDEMAECPNFQEWLTVAVECDEETIQLLRGWLNALIIGRADLQVFLHLIGPGGTGKSTFGRLAFKLVGDENATTTSLKQLETNRFETSSIYGKRLVAIEEAGKYGGSVNVLKAMTGQDPLRLERKNVQQQGSFIYTGQTLMMSNDRLATSDYTGGIDRRRITVEFKKRLSLADRARWAQRGGEDVLLHPEVPGIVNWALGLSYQEVTDIFSNVPVRVMRSNLDAARYNNPIVDWMLECLLPAENVATRVGDKREYRDGSGEVFYRYQGERLYPNYLAWCKRTDRNAVSLQRFSSLLLDAAASFDISVTKKREQDGVKVYGLRIRLDREQSWLEDLESRHSLKG